MSDPGDPYSQLTFTAPERPRVAPAPQQEGPLLGAVVPLQAPSPVPAAPAPPAAPETSRPGGAGWAIREQRAAPPTLLPQMDAPSAATFPVGPPAYGGQPAYGVPPYLPGGGMQYGPPLRRRGSRRPAGVLGVVIVVVVVRIFLSFGTKQALTAFNKTYHAPATVGGMAKSSNPQVTAKIDQITAQLQMPALQNAHSEGAGYTDASGRLAFALIIGQDNLGRSQPRSGGTVADLSGDASTVVTSTQNGLTVSCETASDLQECVWYNDNAAGLFADVVDKSPTAAISVLMPALNEMVS